MLIACHLFVGILTGVILQDRFLDQRIIPLCMLGSLLPDIIDKPLGYLVFPEIGDGRLIAHALIGAWAIGITGILLVRESILPAALLLGVFSHQLLDEMWKIPVNWFYPLFGPFPIAPHEGYFGWGLMRELSTPSEWAFAVVILIFVFTWYSAGVTPKIRMTAVSGFPAVLLLLIGR